ncbi:hypothetical protein [Roseobacter sp. HKCCA0434]|nr:hypothetical protein [Roseobacter sp. HKCCA0434]
MRSPYDHAEMQHLRKGASEYEKEQAWFGLLRARARRPLWRRLLGL